MKIQRFSFIAFFAAVFTVAALAQAGSLDWEEKAEFGVTIKGKIDITAQVFQPTNYQPYLILTSERLKSPVLIDLGKKKVYALKAGDIRVDDSFIHTKGIPHGKSVAKYSMKGGASTFTVYGSKVAMTIRQTLVGEVEAGIILAHSPDYVIRKNAYKPKQKAIKKIKAYKKRTEVIVMFATWCSTCKVVLPQVMRVFEQAANSKFHVRYIGIAQGGGEPRAALERYGHDYPAVIFIQNGKEIGRVLGPTPNPVENAIATTLR